MNTRETARIQGNMLLVPRGAKVTEEQVRQMAEVKEPIYKFEIQDIGSNTLLGMLCRREKYAILPVQGVRIVVEASNCLLSADSVREDMGILVREYGAKSVGVVSQRYSELVTREEHGSDKLTHSLYARS